MRAIYFTSVVACTLALAAPAAAGGLTYSPINPSFGGSPLNSSHLMGMANAQNEPKSKADAARTKAAQEAAAVAKATGVNKSDRFIQLLEAHLYSGLAQKVSEAIFSTAANAPTNGTIKFNDQQVSFLKSPDQIQLTIFDTTTGQSTQITVPTLVTN